MIKKLAERELETAFGTFTEILYNDGQKESIALVMGEIAGGEDVLCRIHSACIGGHVFNSVECTCREEMSAAQEKISQAGTGVIIYLDQEGKGNGHLALMVGIPHKEAGLPQGEPYERAGFEKDARRFRPAAEILEGLGIRSVVLLTGNPGKADDLAKLNVTVTANRRLEI